MSKLKRMYVVVASAAAFLVVGAVAAFATDPSPDAGTTAVITAAGQVKDQLVLVAVGILGFAAFLMSIRLGWRWVSRFLGRA